MFATLFNLIINLLATLIQLICTPVNAIVATALPDVSNWLITASNGLVNIVNSMTWAIGLIPPAVKEVIAFVLVVEIAKHTIFMSTHVLTKVWTVMDKIKFW